jgi:hypothetical protein
MTRPLNSLSSSLLCPRRFQVLHRKQQSQLPSKLIDLGQSEKDLHGNGNGYKWKEVFQGKEFKQNARGITNTGNLGGSDTVNLSFFQDI